MVLIFVIPTQKCARVKFTKFFLFVRNYFLEFPKFFTTEHLGDQNFFLQTYFDAASKCYEQLIC